MSNFKRFDFVYTKDGMMDGYLNEYLGDGIWELQFITSSGGGNFHFHESDLEHGGEIPERYKETIEFVKGLYDVEE